VISGRSVAAILGAIVLFLGASLWLVNWLTGGSLDPRGPGAAGDDARIAAPASSVTGPGSALAGGNTSVAEAIKDLPRVVIVDPAPPPPPPGSWEAVKIAPRPAALGSLGAAVGRELNELQPEVSACFDEDVQARHGTTGFSTVRDTSPQDDAGTTTLVLELETTPEGVRIVDAPVETRGQASDGLLACVQRKLRGLRVETPSARAGQRYRVLYHVAP
jgi:hypothetical protein